LLFKVSKQAVPFALTREIEEMRQNATRCYICNAPFTSNDPAVVDHNHLTGEVRGIAHQSCNVNYNLSHSFVPVFIHNMRGYDEKFLIPELATYQDWEISPLANSSEKFMLLKFAKKPNGNPAKFKFRDPSIVFIDSMQHFGGSIDGNVRQLLAGCFGSTNASDFTKDKKEQSAIRNLFDNAVFVISPQWDDLTLSPAVSPRVQFRTAVSNPDVISKVEEFLM